MNVVKAVHKIKDLLSVEQLERLEQMALQYQRYARIFFKIMALNKEKRTCDCGMAGTQSG